MTLVFLVLLVLVFFKKLLLVSKWGILSHIGSKTYTLFSIFALKIFLKFLTTMGQHCMQIKETLVNILKKLLSAPDGAFFPPQIGPKSFHVLSAAIKIFYPNRDLVFVS